VFLEAGLGASGRRLLERGPMLEAMGFADRLFAHAPHPRLGSPGRLVKIVAPAHEPTVPQLYEALLEDEPADILTPEEPAGLADLQAALRLVAAGRARSITLAGFPDGQALLRVGRALAIGGIVVEPLIRRGGGGLDVRVRRASLE
jgi:hypothetical protein